MGLEIHSQRIIQLSMASHADPKMALMNSGTIYSKTERGRAEIAGRSGQVNPAQRRILILIDGHKTVNDLGAFARAGELEPDLVHLRQLGLIESGDNDEPLPLPAAPGFSAPASPTEAPRPATSPEEFSKVRADASGFVSDRLGAAGAPICGAIERCKSPEELRRLLRGVEAFVGEKLDADTAQSFARHFGKLLL